MTFVELENHVRSGNAPVGVSPYLTALWREARGEWDAAHNIVQDLDTDTAAWIHAYLHRKEGDEGNARYWYQIAGKPFPAGQSLDEEWRDLVRQLIGRM